MDARTYTLLWHDGISEIEIEITLTPEYFKDVAHMEIRSVKPARAPLPITRTGYRSHFLPTTDIDLSEFDPGAEVRRWIEKKARSQKWQNSVLANRQMMLF